MQTSKTAPSLLLIILLVGFPQISETIYTPALPNIAQQLMTSNTLVQWTLSIYFIGFAAGVFYWGRLSDRIGRRPALLLGLVIYGLSSFSCLLATSIHWLLVSRLFQAFGASVGSVITQTILREAFHEDIRPKLFAKVSMALSITPAIGPFIGGYINEYFDWRANFAVLALMSVLLIVYSFLALPETKPQQQTSTKPINFWQLILLFAKDKKIWASIWLIAAINGILFSYYAEAPFIFIDLIGITPGHYGLLGLFIASASMLGSLGSHRLSNNYPRKKILFCGGVIVTVSASLLSLFSVSGWINSGHMALAILLVMLPMAGIILGGFGLILPLTISTALSNYKANLGSAGALLGLSYYLFIAILTWLMGVLHSGTVIPMGLYFLVLALSIFLAQWLLVKE